eukprot:jgi/Chlat1/2111/Chrsp17S02837
MVLLREALACPIRQLSSFPVTSEDAKSAGPQARLAWVLALAHAAISVAETCAHASPSTVNMLRVVLQAEVGDEVGEDQCSLLRLAISGGDLKLVTDLVAAGADVNAANSAGHTPLMLAAITGSADIVPVLAHSHAALEARNAAHETAIYFAANLGHVAAVLALLESGADADARNIAGWSSLMAAANAGHAVVVNLLLERVVSAAPDRDGTTALHLAASNGHKRVCKSLLDSGKFHVDAENRAGLRALDMAIANKQVDIIKLLLKSGASLVAHNGQSYVHLVRNQELHEAFKNEEQRRRVGMQLVCERQVFRKPAEQVRERRSGGLHGLGDCNSSPKYASSEVPGYQAGWIAYRQMRDEAMEEDLQRARVFDELAHDFKLEMQPCGMITSVSPAGAAILGYRAAELIGRNAFELLKTQDRLHVEAVIRERVQNPQATMDLPKPFEFRFVRRDNTIIWMTASGVRVVTSAKGAVKVMMVARDISQKKALEDEMSLLGAAARLSQDVIWLFYINTPLTAHVSDTVFDELGYRPSELVGKPGFDTIFFEDLWVIHQSTASGPDAPLDPSRAHCLRYRRVHKDGRLIWYEVTKRTGVEPRSDRLLYVVVERNVMATRPQQDYEHWVKQTMEMRNQSPSPPTQCVYLASTDERDMLAKRQQKLSVDEVVSPLPTTQETAAQLALRTAKWPDCGPFGACWPDVLLLFDPNGKVLRMSTTCEENYGYSPLEYVGHHFMLHAHPEDVEQVRVDFPMFFNGLRADIIKDASEDKEVPIALKGLFSFRRQCKNGGSVMVEASYKVILHDLKLKPALPYEVCCIERVIEGADAPDDKDMQPVIHSSPQPLQQRPQLQQFMTRPILSGMGPSSQAPYWGHHMAQNNFSPQPMAPPYMVPTPRYYPRDMAVLPNNPTLLPRGPQMFLPYQGASPMPVRPGNFSHQRNMYR